MSHRLCRILHLTYVFLILPVTLRHNRYTAMGHRHNGQLDAQLDGDIASYSVSFSHENTVTYEDTASVIGFGSLNWYPNLKSKIISTYIFYICILLSTVLLFLHMHGKVHRNWQNMPLDQGLNVFMWFWVYIFMIAYTVVATIDLWFRESRIKPLHNFKDSFFHATSALCNFGFVFYLVLSLYSRMTTAVGTISVFVDDIICCLLPAFFLFVEGISLSHKYSFSVVNTSLSCLCAATMIGGFVLSSEITAANYESPVPFDWPYEFQYHYAGGLRAVIYGACIFSLPVFHKLSCMLSKKLWPEFSFADSSPFIN